MVDINWQRVHSRGNVSEISLLVATFSIAHSRGPKDLKVEVFQYPNGQYEGVANYAFWGPEQATPYKSVRLKNTIEEAVDDAIRGFMAFDKEQFSPEQIFWVKSDCYCDDVYVDGNGEIVEQDEVRRRRAEYTRG